MKKLITTGIVLALCAGCGAAVSSGGSDTPASPAATQDATQGGGGGSVHVDPAPATASGTANMTVAQEQAVQSAESYLDMGGFSKSGLIGQLSSPGGEGFSRTDAEYAVNHVDVDWNAQAVLSARSYMDMGGFSRSSLIGQLSSPGGEGFTHAQAVYATNAVGL